MARAQDKRVTATLDRINAEGFSLVEDSEPSEIPCDERGIAEIVSIGRPIRSDDDVVDFGQKLISSIASGQISETRAGVIVRAFQVMTTFKMGINGHSPGGQINILQQILAPSAPSVQFAPAEPKTPLVLEGEVAVKKAGVG